ncbi:HD-GYP domain-containing protein [Streptomyces sp. NPDC056254]|uniref:HD-GYP domain-containing protein n=1 Tax=Streptomyces sp. NPDC056254 TaxID=3345763 RepID=UPI0035D7AB9F
MRDLPPAARGFVLCAVLATLACTAPALTDSASRPAVILLAGLYLGCELAKSCPLPGLRVPEGTGPFLPVVLAAVYLLPPAAAALVALPGAFAAPAARPAGLLRRMWHAAQQSIGAWTAGQVFALLAGPDALGAGASGGPGSGAGAGPSAWPADFPYALLPATAAAAALCLVVTALDGAILAAAEVRPLSFRLGSPPGRLLPAHSPVTRALGPYCVHGLAGLMTAVMWRSPYGLPAALLVLLPTYVSCRVFAQYHRERAAHQATIRALVQAVDIKDRYTRGHSERVGQASAMIARELGMAEERLEVVRMAGVLHDVGKLGLPTRLLRKDGPLTPQERRIIELHPEYGHEMVRGIGFLGEARSAILHHHERVDGSGYPYGLTGEQIPVLARVVAVADAFDAMTSTRSYSRARPVPTALAELDRCAGAQFDPAMVRALADAIARHGWHPAATTDDDLQVISAEAPAPAAVPTGRGLIAPPPPPGHGGPLPEGARTGGGRQAPHVDARRGQGADGAGAGG